jgi:Cd2+/Zn2+-exporting ATPase
MESYSLKNLDCATCAAKLEKDIENLPSVKKVSIDFATQSMKIETDDLEGVKKVIARSEPKIVVAPVGEKTEKENGSPKRELVTLGIGTALFILAVLTEDLLHGTRVSFLEYILFGSAYLLTGYNVLFAAGRNILRGKVFDETFLMTVSTAGAFAIHALEEAVGVMLFYKIGEILQDLSVSRSRRSIRKLLELRPREARISEGGEFRLVKPEEVAAGTLVNVRPGEQFPLDGIVVDGSGLVDTQALTGESVPRRVENGSEVLSGYINLDASLTLRTTHTAKDSGISKIIELVENASHAKSKVESFITRFARVYSPLVVGVAAAVAFLPPLLIPGASVSDWVYRALTILVVSCPCALVISIPLGYFGGIGGASKRGILFKGANYLDSLSKVSTLVFDKTGTLTNGTFRVRKVVPKNGYSESMLLEHAAHAESHSNHPIASSIRNAWEGPVDPGRVTDARERAGRGITAFIDGRRLAVGNDALMHDLAVPHDTCTGSADSVRGSIVHIAIDETYAGYLVIGDEIKEGTSETLKSLPDLGIKRIAMLSGDGREAAEGVAKEIGIEEVHAELLPGEKLAALKTIMGSGNGKNGFTAFVGDGINDAPVLAGADIGIALGERSSDIAMETADIVILSGKPEKIVEAFEQARKTRRIVTENIVFALAVKAGFIVLGAFGIATMWEAVIGDVGVALAAILNAGRALRPGK